MPLNEIDDAVELISMEYDVLPSLKLTPWQAQRLWNFPDDVCMRALQRLTDSSFLARTGDGAYVRRSPPASIAASTHVLRDEHRRSPD